MKKYRVYVIIFAVMLITFGKGFVEQVNVKNKLSAQIYELEKTKEQLNTEIEGIKRDIENKDTEEFIVKIAREKLKMVKKNEIIVKYKN